jgi:predicted homoserine dehydrogenase-like protein
LELNISILSAALRGEATGAPTGFRGDVVSTAKRNLRAGEILDGEGGGCVWGRLLPARTSVEIGGLPIGLANRVKLVRDVHEGQCITWSDVHIDETDETYRYRREMESQSVPHPIRQARP